MKDERITWQTEASVEANVPIEFAWQFMIDVSNWADPPARFSLEGPFEAGTEGETTMPGQRPVRWWLAEITPKTRYVIDYPMEGAQLSFVWQFESVSDESTLLTQEIVLTGEKAANFKEGIAAGFGEDLESGMERIAGMIEEAFEG